MLALFCLVFAFKLKNAPNTKAFRSIVNICILPAYLNWNVNVDGSAEWSLLWFRSTHQLNFLCWTVTWSRHLIKRAARLKVNEGRCPAEIEHPLRANSQKKKPVSESYFWNEASSSISQHSLNKRCYWF